MKKRDRHAIIKTLVNDEVIRKQEDFVDRLNQKGVEVTQATVSRDIKELKLVKVPSKKGGHQYSLPEDNEEDYSDQLRRMLKSAFVSIDTQREFVLLKTIPGNGYSLSHLIEKNDYDEVFGVLGGDDTILIICLDEKKANDLMVKIIALI